MTGAARRFDLLDGLRGVAAFSVVIGHATGPVLNPNFALAVPFFFMLSGFVLTFAYGGRLSTRAEIQRYLLHRLARLQPMIVVSSLVGCLLLGLQYRSGALGPAGLGEVITAQVLSFTTLPMPFVGMHETRWPVNVVEWSLFFELLASVSLVWLLRAKVSTVLLIGGAGCVADMVLDIRTGFIAAGLVAQLAVTVFSFSVGSVLYRVHTQAWTRVRLPTTGMLVLAMAVVLYLPWKLGVLLEFVILVVLFPAVILASCSTDVPPWLRRGATLSGELSYPVYILHWPLLGFVQFYAPAIGQPGQALLTIAASVVASMVLLDFYDRPVRRWLRRGIDRDAAAERVRNPRPRQPT